MAFLGDEGRISLVSLKSRQLTGTLKMAGSARAAAFAPDGQQLLSLGARMSAGSRSSVAGLHLDPPSCSTCIAKHTRVLQAHLTYTG